MQDNTIESNNSLDENYARINPLVLKVGLGVFGITIVAILAVILLQPEKQEQPSIKIDPLAQLLSNTVIPTNTSEEKIEEGKVDPLVALLSVGTNDIPFEETEPKSAPNSEQANQESKSEENTIIDQNPVIKENTLTQDQQNTITLPLKITLPEGVIMGNNFIIASEGEPSPLQYPQQKIQVMSPLDVVVIMKPGGKLPFLASPVFKGQTEVVLDANTTAVSMIYTVTGLYAETIDTSIKQELLLNAIKTPEFVNLTSLVKNNIEGGGDETTEEKIIFLAKKILNSVK